jgi:hypothetical protein
VKIFFLKFGILTVPMKSADGFNNLAAFLGTKVKFQLASMKLLLQGAWGLSCR